MSITSTTSSDGTQITISVSGRFDFSAHEDFRACYDPTDSPMEAAPASYIIDLAQTVYLDSSALGMLLLLREHAGGDESTIAIVNCNADVRKILGISNFEQLFTIH